MTTTLIVPGLKSSGPAHWQSWFEQHIPGTVRVVQRDWHDPNLADWSGRIRREISRTPGRLLIVAHSFGALAAAQAASDHDDRIAGALFVAPADPDKFSIADYLPAAPLSFPSVVVASTNDPWMSLNTAANWADRWGADFVNLGAAGHINADSGFGPWPEGLALLERLRRASELRTASDVRAALRSDARRRSSRTGGGLRLASSRRLTDDRRDVTWAAALLEDAGWTIAPPLPVEVVATAQRQYSGYDPGSTGRVDASCKVNRIN